MGEAGKMRFWRIEKGKKQPEDESWCTETPIKNDSHWKTRQHTERKRRDCRKMGKAKVIARILIRRGKGDVKSEQCGGDGIR